MVERGSALGLAHLPVGGAHNVENALGVVGAARGLGLSFEEIARGLIWKDRPSRVFFMSPAPSRKGVIPEGADVGPDEAASTTNHADMRGLLRGAEPHDRGSSGAASV